VGRSAGWGSVAEADRPEHSPYRYDRSVPAAATPAIAQLIRARIDHRVLEYALPERHGAARDERPDYGLEAAAALGLEPGRVGKTLIASVDGALVAAVLPVDRQLDLKALAMAVGRRRAVLAEPAAAERAAGSVVGGISPLGMRRGLPVVVDRGLMGHPLVCVSAGRRGLQVELAPAALVAATGAAIGAIARSA
jgi:Cys-tRNA(Pro)/Cys-tRNA(Cys) deacylase